MALTNYERVGKALDLLGQGLRPFVERSFQAALGDGWRESVIQTEAEGGKKRREDPLRDVLVLLKVVWDQWHPVFGKTLGQAERTLVSELREVRNRWAHQEAFSTDDAYRALDSAHRLLQAVSAAKEAQEVDHQKQELLRIRFDEQARKTTRRAAELPLEGQPASGLRPWRDIVTPHPDVASGRYQQAEFAADLGQVHRGEGSAEYKEPREFFRRTYLTEGLRRLLANAIQRLTNTGGDPVVELQTNFGGGKTHALLALYHLASGVPPNELPGIEQVLQAAGTSLPSTIRRAVLVGTALSPGQPQRKPDGTTVRTIWGELAWQLGGKEGYQFVAESDANGTSPGDRLNLLFRKYAPCLILIDEWVAYTRQLYGNATLPGGTFDTHFTFAQALTEAAKEKGVLVVVSTPASDIEIGGEGGREALSKIKNVVGRIQSPWRPASAEESFEIVRRRLFEDIRDPADFRARDAVVRAFSDLYRSQAQEFPSECREADYERRMRGAYPIHPELFDRLYSDWSSLEKFQRTRGVLRLMAAAIHSLWERQDAGLLILPASVPIDDPRVQFELTRYLEDNWVPIIEKEVDGPTSLPLGLDRENPNLGRYSTCRRVARTLYLGSAPTHKAAHRGLEDHQVKLGCVQPGESPAVFGDALRRLTDRAMHLYVDGKRYWLSTTPTVTRLAQDRAERREVEEVHQETIRRLRAERQRGDFAAVHAAPGSSGEVPDESDVRLVILGPDHPHSARTKDSSARGRAAQILGERGNSPRNYANMLVFLAPDKSRLDDLDQAVRQYLAWKSIEKEHDQLNLDAFQENQAKTKSTQADETVQQRIPETFQWLLIPTQPDPKGPIGWEEIRLQGTEPLAVRASKKLRNEEYLITEFSPSRLRMELDKIPLWRGDHVGLRQLWEDFAKYLYLPRLRDSSVLVKAVQAGVALLTWQQDAFAYAEGWDDVGGRYRGLRAGQQTSVVMDAQSLLVKPDVAGRQLEEEARRRKEAEAGKPTEEPGKVTPEKPKPPEPPEQLRMRRFHGSVRLDPTRLPRDASQVADEIVQHLVKLNQAEVEIHLEIHAQIPEGAPDDVVRTVTENCRTLKFTSHGFEKE